jgi:hypothetical protein
VSRCPVCGESVPAPGETSYGGVASRGLAAASVSERGSRAKPWQDTLLAGEGTTPGRAKDSRRAGEPIVHESWTCEHCEARQHPECAAYFGGCAIFACRDARAPVALEIQSWPEHVKLLRQLATVSRWKARAALAYLGVGMFLGAWVLGPWWWTGVSPGWEILRGLFIGQLLMCVMTLVFLVDEPIRHRIARRTRDEGAGPPLEMSIDRIRATLPAQAVPAALDAVTRPRVVIWLSVGLFALMLLLFATRHPIAATAVVFTALFAPIAMAGLSRALADIGDTARLLCALEAERARALPAKAKLGDPV